MATTTGELKSSALACASGVKTGGREDGGAGGAPDTRHKGHSEPCIPSSSEPVLVCTNILVAPVLEQTISMERGCTTGEATATPSARTNHARTHARRLKRVLKIVMPTSLGSSNMNHIDADHPLLLGRNGVFYVTPLQ